MRKHVIALFATLLFVALLLPGVAFADTITNKYPSWNAAVNAFLNDSRYSPGAGKEAGYNCEQYAWDYAEFVYDFDQMEHHRITDCFYYDFSEIRTGDIVRFSYEGSQDTVYHSFIVLNRSGNKLETIESNWSEGVISRSSSHYSLSGSTLVVSDAPAVTCEYNVHLPNIYAGWSLDNAVVTTCFEDCYMDAIISQYSDTISASQRAKIVSAKPLEMLLNNVDNVHITWGTEQNLVLGEHYDVKTRFADVPGQKNPVGIQIITGKGQFAGSRKIYVTDVDVAGALVKDPNSDDFVPDYYYDPNYYDNHTMREIAAEDDSLAEYIADSTVTRLAGDGALDTMKAVVEAGKFKAGGTVVLANAWGYHDALTAAGIAGLENAPVVMTDGASLSAQAKALLQSLKPAKIVVCGGTGTVSKAVADAAKKAAGAKEVVRAAGSNAAGTAVDIFKKGSGWAKTAIVATSGTYHDALAAAPLSYAAHLPIFMTEWTGALSGATIKAMKDGGIEQAYVAGGSYWIPDSTLEQLQDAGIKVVKRLAGDTAVETSSAIAAEAVAKYKMRADNLGVATTASHYDALAGAAFCGKNKSVLLLAAGPDSRSITDYILGNASSINRAYIFGGTSSVSTDTMKMICAAS